MRLRLSAATLLAALLLVPGVLARQSSPASVPASISDKEYWSLIESMSEPNGYFQSDNLVSNERMFQNLVPGLLARPHGGAYLGVAPDQNFTYILAVAPQIAFICDIRRGNLHEHMLYKALFDLSKDRAEFLSRLFSRPRPKDAGPDTSVTSLFAAFAGETPDDTRFKENVKAVEDRLTKTHGFGLTPDDLQGIEYVYGMFKTYGPDLTYSSSNAMRRGGSFGGRGFGGRGMPTYGDLQTTTDFAGDNRAYLATEATFQAIKAFEAKNLLVPVVGDFAGTKALRAIGAYLTEHHAVVNVFYTSNVEQYLFQNGVAAQYYANVATLPLDDNSAFIRSARGVDVIDPIQPFLKDLSDGKIRGYADVTSRGAIR
ncbi:MAG TPA: hypothetical protein VFP90_15300 [Gemmatimonadaceae bacterium]|nr:hypothetical protein [Gemmatimonadaceae bacterium]